MSLPSIPPALSQEEIRTRDDSLEFARRHKNEIARELTNLTLFLPDALPVSVFMAGSPGAGKTESSQNLIKKFSSDHPSILRIDPDELRTKFSTYTGKNSHLFQGATSIIVDRMHDLALKNKQSFVFDGTLTNLEKSRDNIRRSVERGRFVQIIYVYQDPLQAWEFVKARTAKDGRHVPKEAFIKQYFLARENTNCLKGEFGKQIQVDLITKNIDGTDFSYRQNIETIDSQITEKYGKGELHLVIKD